jgi:hypothetical protein
MTGGKPRNGWLRMTDAMRLTEPGKKAQWPSSRILLFMAILWSVSTVTWSAFTFMVSDGTPIYVLLSVMSLVLAIANYVMWRQSRKRTIRTTSS